MEKFDHQKIEKETQKYWEESGIYTTDLSETKKDPYYLLFEFPYPSGDLHIGHWYAFALTDIFARFKRMQGKNVLFPMGFDSFGLPAENAAIKHGVNPREWTYANMDRMRAQVKSMGTSVDWSKEVVSSDPEYYRWTQWLFSKLYEHGLAERRNAAVKWCPKDQTVLANEQVTDGKCERCGTEVEEKTLTQWFFTITKYAKRLLEDLDALPWKEEIKDAQRAWIGESKGAKLSFPVKDTEVAISVFTTRPDTLFGSTYVVLAPEHPLVGELLSRTKNKEDIENYVSQVKKKTERERLENKEKTGVLLEGIDVINPATKELIPVFIADYVLASYGTGAVMAVPAHDERDYVFAQKFSLPVKQVLVTEAPVPYTGSGVLQDSGEFSGMSSEEAKEAIVKFVEGELTTNYRIRDWLVSRQRYWGCPIPVVYDPEGTPHIVPSEHLPWLLPEDVDFTLSGKSPLATSKELKERVTTLFGEGWTPEYDTLDTFVDSSWYFLRYLDPEDVHDFSDQALMKKWLPVDRYSGGSEHTTMHLLYARFFHKALYDLALVPTPEPFNERMNRGLIMGPDGQKMSKSKGNVVNPDEFVQKFGADAVRMYLAFIGPYNEPGNYPWSLDGVVSMRRFLDRIVWLSGRLVDEEPDAALRKSLSQASTKVATDTERFKFNTAISSLMVLVRDMDGYEKLSKAAYKDLLLFLAPFAPHLAEHLWKTVGGTSSIHLESFPHYPDGVEETEMTIIVQVNGKKRGEITVPVDATQDVVEKGAETIPSLATLLHEEQVIRKIYVPGRILNFVINKN
ncbi:leucine--tRNA ligase [Patescibacteria group bacterium]|nr:leucine--tRNA ligase [Patescibacteria group bacterium]MBU1500904.1 leucine--tRNA ligase [Patescibacteria group bacterium]MBU2080959.1 leucine--tRNA ligase [Patescibacteria group bacterium]MBU2124064.1 leucine--tRNA ligase [Patescibacteria group bacterium]MBU2194645.1 leucine--tRNA ligase [Patescibacteria group bacterium]